MHGAISLVSGELLVMFGLTGLRGLTLFVLEGKSKARSTCLDRKLWFWERPVHSSFSPTACQYVCCNWRCFKHLQNRLEVVLLEQSGG